MNSSLPQIIRASGNVVNTYPQNSKIFSLEELQKIVGGHIEMVSLSDGRMMTLNEEGKLLDLPFNPIATGLFNKGERITYDPIMGDVLVCYGNWLEADEPDDEDLHNGEYEDDDDGDDTLIDRASTDVDVDVDEYDPRDDYDLDDPPF